MYYKADPNYLIVLSLKIVNYIKGAMCKISEDLLTEMQYKIHYNVFSGVKKTCYVIISL